MKLKIILLTTILLASLLLASAPLSNAQSRPIRAGIDLHISGPTEIFVNDTTTYRLEVGGSFSSRGNNWSIELTDFVSGLIITPPSSESNVTNIFNIDIRAVQSGSYTLSFKGFCSDGEEIRYGESSLKIRALKPSTVKVEIVNPSVFELKNVTIGVFVNGVLKGTSVIPSLAPERTANVIINWSKEDLSPGSHSLEVWVVYGYGDGVTFVKDELLISRTIYVSGKGVMEEYGWAIGLFVVGIVGITVFYMLRKKGKKRRPW